MRFPGLLLIVIMMLLAGCDQASMMKKLTPPEAESTARGYIDLLRQNKLEEIEKDLDSSVRTADSRNRLATMAKMIPAQNPQSVKVVGTRVNVFHQPNNPETTTTNMTFEYQFPNKWLLINVATQKKEGVLTIVSFHVDPIPDSLEKLNKFRLVGKNPLQYSVFVLAILIPLFSLYALIQCIRTKIDKRKWLWVLFVLFGLAKFSVNWTTGQWKFTPLAFQLFGAGSFAPPYGPWIISISLPLGAIIFMLKRKGLSKQQNDAAQTGESEPVKEDWLTGLDK